MSTVKFAGFSRVAGALKFRAANDVKRIDQLRKLGDTDVVILALPNEMSKNDAAKFVLTNLSGGAYFVDTKEAEAVLTATIKDENPFAKPKAAKKPRTVKVTKTRLIIGKATVSADDAPYTPKQAAKIRAEFMKKLKSAYEAN
jgi:predicted GTPase